MSLDDRKDFRSFIFGVAKEADLNWAERVKLRIVMRWAPDKLLKEIMNHAMVEGLVPVGATPDSEVGAIDLEKLAAFIKEVLPAILQLVMLFL